MSTNTARSRLARLGVEGRVARPERGPELNTGVSPRPEREQLDEAEPAQADPPPADRHRHRLGPTLLVMVAIGFGAIIWRAELTPVLYLNDSSVQEQMVRFATSSLRVGRDPLTAWFPYLGLGSPQFLHYQSLESIVTGAVGLLIGPNRAFRLSLYLLLVGWPLPVYAAGRVVGMERWAAAVAAAASALLVSVTGVGYEAKAYVWIGYGLWAQLWASWTLPLAWAFTWRALASRRMILPATVFVAATAALHFETGYLAILPLAFLPFLVPSDLLARLGRATCLAGTSFLATAWVIIPLLLERTWAATNQILRHTPLVNGYGARRTLTWLVEGKLFDAGRLPVVTVLVAAGLLVALWSWRREPLGRLLLALFGFSLVLSFGRTTFGELANLLPGGRDVFYRRFAMGADLAGVFLAGQGALALGRGVVGLVARARRARPHWLGPASGGAVGTLALVGLVVGVLSPAWWQLTRYAATNSSAVAAQAAVGPKEEGLLAPIEAIVARRGGGRVYAGMPSNWGADFRVGAVPVFKAIEAADLEEVGYTLRTASLMTGPEYFFDEARRSDYELFGIRYLLLPVDMTPPVPAARVASSGPYALWKLPDIGYVAVGEPIGVMVANRSDIGTQSLPYLRSGLAREGRYLAVAFAGTLPPPLTLPGRTLVPPVGHVLTESRNLADGVMAVRVKLARRAVVVLSASFDPGWSVRIDGKAAPIQMVAPALVGVVVPAGAHQVVFRYVGFPYYPELWAAGLAGLAAATLLGITASRSASDDGRTSTLGSSRPAGP